MVPGVFRCSYWQSVVEGLTAEGGDFTQVQKAFIFLHHVESRPENVNMTTLHVGGEEERSRTGNRSASAGRHDSYYRQRNREACRLLTQSGRVRLWRGDFKPADWGWGGSSPLATTPFALD